MIIQLILLTNSLTSYKISIEVFNNLTLEILTKPKSQKAASTEFPYKSFKSNNSDSKFFKTRSNSKTRASPNREMSKPKKCKLCKGNERCYHRNVKFIFIFKDPYSYMLGAPSYTKSTHNFHMK